ncbi:MAG: thiamine phosphate synthase [bacterium]
MEKVKNQEVNSLSESLLYLLTPPDITDPDALISMVVLAVRAGADIIQFRNKSANTRELIEIGSRLCEAVHAEGALFLVNDRVDVAIATGSDGVHLGQEDLPPSWARRILGQKNDKIIGLSTHSVEQALQAESEGVDYIGFGPVYSTPAKSGWPAIGTESFAKLNEKLRIPYFAIGGIDLFNIGQVINSGASRIAACNGVFGHDDLVHAAALLKKELLLKNSRDRF